MEQLNPLQFIRIGVFKNSQTGMAETLGVLQSQISKWEARGHCSYEQQKAYRKAAKRMKLPWSDSYFFEVPRHAKSSWQTCWDG